MCVDGSKRKRARGVVVVLGTVLAVVSGCGQESIPPNATPVVSPDSPQGKQALAEHEQMLLERQKQEAKARSRSRLKIDPEATN